VERIFLSSPVLGCMVIYFMYFAIHTFSVCFSVFSTLFVRIESNIYYNQTQTRMWANAQRDGRPAEYRWRPLFNAAKSG